MYTYIYSAYIYHIQEQKKKDRIAQSYYSLWERARRCSTCPQRLMRQNRCAFLSLSRLARAARHVHRGTAMRSRPEYFSRRQFFIKRPQLPPAELMRASRYIYILYIYTHASLQVRVTRRSFLAVYCRYTRTYVNVYIYRYKRGRCKIAIVRGGIIREALLWRETRWRGSAKDETCIYISLILWWTAAVLYYEGRFFCCQA